MSKQILIEDYLSTEDNEIAFNFLYTAFKARYTRLEGLIQKLPNLAPEKVYIHIIICIRFKIIIML